MWITIYSWSTIIKTIKFKEIYYFTYLPLIGMNGTNSHPFNELDNFKPVMYESSYGCGYL